MKDLTTLLKESISLLNKKEFSKARKTLKEAAKASPNNPDIWQLLGAAEKNIGDYTSAKESYQRSLALNGRQPQTLNNFGNLLFSRQEYSEAIEVYRRALDLSPNHPDALFNLANTYLKFGQPKTAITHFKKALNFYPDSSKIKLGLAEAFTDAEEIDLAHAIINAELEASSNNLSTLFKAGTLFRASQHWHMAIQCLEKALDLSPENATIMHHLASVYASNGDFEKAKDYFFKCTEIEPKNSEHHYWLNSLLWIDNDPNFLCSYKKAFEKTPSEKFLLDYASFLQSTGDRKAALEKIEKFSKYEQLSVEATIKFSDILRQENRANDALALINDTLNVAPKNHAIIEEKARTLIEIGDIKSASDLMARVIKDKRPTQSQSCLQATTLKLSNQDEYAKLTDYGRFVKTYSVPAPENYSSLASFLKDVKHALLKLHLAQKAPVEQSLRNGTQSFDCLFRYSDPIIQLLRSQIALCVSEHINRLPHIPNHPLCGQKQSSFKFTDSWSVQLKSGGHHKSHFHPRGWISSVLYIDVPAEIDQEGQGWLEFGVPDLNLASEVDGDYYIKPEPGLLVLFPSYLWHGTRKFTSTSNRLTVAFDVVPESTV